MSYYNGYLRVNSQIDIGAMYSLGISALNGFENRISCQLHKFLEALNIIAFSCNVANR